MKITFFYATSHQWFEKICPNSDIFFTTGKAKNLREAFDKSIEKWELRSQGKIVKFEVASCGLCDLYFNLNCDRCPIRIEIWLISCSGTPYHEWLSESRTGENPELPLAIKVAEKEVKFLKELKKKYVTKREEKK